MTHTVHAQVVYPDGTSSHGPLKPKPAAALRLVSPPPSAASGPVLIVPAAALQAREPRPGRLLAIWRRWFGPPAIDVRGARSDFGVFRAMYEIGSDYLPSSGTWPAP